MRPLTEDKPKALVQLLGRPLIDYTFDAIPDQVTEVVMVVGYRHEQLRAYLGAEFRGKKVEYVQQEKVTGTADALRLARPLLGDGRFLTYYADDVYTKADAEKLFEHQYAILVAEVENPKVFGVVELAADNHIVSFEEWPEKPKSNLVSAGIMLLDDTIFRYEAPIHPTKGERCLPDLVLGLMADAPVYGVRATRWIPIGYPEDLERATQMLERS